MPVQLLVGEKIAPDRGDIIGEIDGATVPDRLRNLAGLLREAANELDTLAGRPATPPISPDMAAHVLWHFGCDGGFGDGRFTALLLRAITGADPENRARFALGFPGYVAAVTLAQNVDDGVAQLQSIAAENVAPGAPS